MEIRIPTGIEIGHAHNDRTGVTVILAPEGAVCGADVRGGAPGTRETALLASEKKVDRVNAVVLAGGSAYGLEACCGVMNFLRERGSGFGMGDKVVPIVTGAVIYDLNGEGYVYPDIAMGYEACRNASRTPVWGRVGCGRGATVGKFLGEAFAQPGGVGAATIECGEGFVTAVIAVNACGDVYENGEIVAGARSPAGGFVNARKTILSGRIPAGISGKNTTIGCIMTDIVLNKVQANKLSAVAHNGLARAISPVHTDYDGDTLFALSKGGKRCDFTVLEVCAVEAVERAVAAAVRCAGN